MTTPDFETFLVEGTRHLLAGNPKDALPLLLEANERDPDHFQAALNLSSAYILLSRFRLAVPLLERLRQREPENPRIWQNLGAAYLGNPVLATDEQQRKAIASFQRAWQIDPSTPNVAYNLGLIYRDRGEAELAIHWFTQALEHNPRDRDAQRNLKRLSQADGGLEDSPIE